MESGLTSRKSSDETPLEDISGLIPRYIRSRDALDRAEFQNITKINRKYFLTKPNAKKAPFTSKWLLELHHEMFGEVWEWAGKIRKSDVGIGSPVVKIGSELHHLIYELRQWEEKKENIFEIAVKLHHRLVKIHPFHGGNGRWARTVANIYLKQHGFPLFEWPEDEIKIENQIRKDYVSALRKADEGNIEALLDFHRKYWKRSD